MYADPLRSIPRRRRCGIISAAARPQDTMDCGLSNETREGTCIEAGTYGGIWLDELLAIVQRVSVLLCYSSDVTGCAYTDSNIT